MLELNAKTTALVVIDLQEGILPLPVARILPMRWLIAPGSWREISREQSARVSGARWLVCRLCRSIKTAG